MYIPVSTTYRQMVPFMIQETDANLQDELAFNLDSWTKMEHYDLFFIHPQPILPLRDLDMAIAIKITFERDLNKKIYSRRRFNTLDLLAQFGGFMGIFRWIFGTFMAAWNTNALDNFMVSKLYQVQTAS